MNNHHNTQELGIGWLYVVTHANAQGLVKIGITDRPEKRMGELGNLTVLARVPLRHPRRHEHRLHARYHAKRVPQTEWYALDEEELTDLFLRLEQLARPFLDLIVLPSDAANESESSSQKDHTQELQQKTKVDSEPQPSSTRVTLTMADLINRYGPEKAMRIDQALRRANRDPDWRAEMLRDHGLV